jgi:hypothetical protein
MRDESPWVCPLGGCGLPAPRTFLPNALPGCRVEDSENIGLERGADRPGEILGLPEIKTSLGRDGAGRERFAFRPANVGDVPNRAAFLEAAKRAGLSPGDGGRYRTVGQR